MTDRFNDNTVFRGGQLPDVGRFARYGKLSHTDFIDKSVGKMRTERTSLLSQVRQDLKDSTSKSATELSP